MSISTTSYRDAINTARLGNAVASLKAIGAGISRAGISRAGISRAGISRAGISLEAKGVGGDALLLRRFLRVTAALILLSISVMVLGPLVRAEDAGLACPDWPLCFDRFLPQMDYRIFLEWFHRLTAGLLSLLFLGWFYMILRFKPLRSRYLLLSAGAALLLLLQIFLGGLTVILQLEASVVNWHLLNSILFISCLICVWRLARTPFLPKFQDSRQGRGWLSVILPLLILLLVLLQLFLGGRVSSNEAGRVCSAFPACYFERTAGLEGEEVYTARYFPPMVGNMERHMTHRFMAALLLLTALFWFWQAWRSRHLSPTEELRRAALFLFLMLAQIAVGALNVIYGLPTWITVLHSFLAYMIYLTIFIIFLESYFAYSRFAPSRLS